MTGAVEAGGLLDGLEGAITRDQQDLAAAVLEERDAVTVLSEGVLQCGLHGLASPGLGW